MEMDQTGPTPYEFDKWNCQVFINIKKYKIVFKIRKDHLRIIFFLGNIYEIFPNLIVMTLLNLNQFLIITQAELCLEGTLVKSKFHVSYHFFSICENPRRKIFINLSIAL